jgi:hypothetical protein
MYGRQSVNPQVIEKIVEKIVEIEKTTENKTKNKKTVIIKRPNGEEETVIVENETSNSTSEKTKSKETTTKKKPSKIASKKYKAGMLVHAKPYEVYQGKSHYSYSMVLSHKFFDKIWLDAQYNFKNKEVGIGASIEF